MQEKQGDTSKIARHEEKRHNSECNKVAKTKKKNKKQKQKTKTTIKRDMKHNLFMQTFRVCKKELLHCGRSNLTLSFHGS
jgi:hypothetical protein